MYHKLNYPTVVRKKVNLKSFRGGLIDNESEKIADLSHAKITYNFNYANGALKKCLGLDTLKGVDYSLISDLSVEKVYFYRRFNTLSSTYDERIIYYCDDKKLYYFDYLDRVLKKISDVVFMQAPSAVQYEYMDNDVMLFANPNGSLYYLNDETLTEIENAPPISSLCVHKERVFVTTIGDGGMLWFSDDFDPTNWSISLNEAGFIDLSDGYGKLLKVVSFLDYVYVFREYGITRIYATGAQEDFRVDNLYGNIGKIVGDSVTVCGDVIYMLTTSGFYKFNGVDAIKTLTEYERFLGDFDMLNVQGVFYNGNLYFSLNLNLVSGNERALLVYNVSQKSSYLVKDIPIINLLFCSGNINGLFCTIKNSKELYKIDDSGKFRGISMFRKWTSVKTDFGISEKLKTLYKVSVYTKEAIKLDIVCDDKERSFQLIGGGVAEVYPLLKGEEFEISILSSSNDPEICNLALYLEYVKGNK